MRATERSTSAARRDRREHGAVVLGAARLAHAVHEVGELVLGARDEAAGVLGHREGEQRHHAVGLDLDQALGDAAGLARGEAVVEQQEVREAVVQVEVGEHPAGTVRHARGHQGLAMARLLVQHRFERHLGNAAQLDVGGGDQQAGDGLAPRRGNVEQGVVVGAVAGFDAAEEAVAGELVVALPLQPEALGLEQHVAGFDVRCRLAELPGQRGEVVRLAPGAAFMVQEGQVGDEFRGVQRHRRARMHLVVEDLAQGMLFEQGGHDGGGRGRGRAHAPGGWLSGTILAHVLTH